MQTFELEADVPQLESLEVIEEFFKSGGTSLNEDLALLRYCLSDRSTAFSSELLFKLPELVEKKLPVYHFEKIQDHYDRDMQIYEEINR